MRPEYEIDIENMRGFFEVKLWHFGDTRTTFKFALYPGSPPLDIATLSYILSKVTIYSFNGIHYDLPILTLALHGATHEQLREASDKIIQGQMKSWDFYRHYGIEPPEYIDHVDLYEVAPGVRIGLKMYMGRMHSQTMQDLPYAHDKIIETQQERDFISDYCDNDGVGTNELKKGCAGRLQLRVAIGARYGIDVRSRSDAQIAEAIIKHELPFDPNKRYINHGFTFKYTPPEYVRFVSPQLQQMLATVRAADFMVSDKEEAIALFGVEEGGEYRTGVQIPDQLKGVDICIGKAKYRMGIGGLHSQEGPRYFLAQPGVFTIKDIDVKSYYPSLILQAGMYPEQLGEAFLTIYRTIYERRLLSKEEAARLYSIGAGLGGVEGDEMVRLSKELQTESDGLKIVLNGTFGKLFSKWSIMYAPELGIAVTMGGQLALLMLIEMMELSGIEVISANTDGIVLLIPHGFDRIAKEVVKWWEQTTGLEMEETHYKSIFQRDVNNYLAFTTDGKAKRKGVFTPSGLLSGPAGKHPDCDIVADACVEFLGKGVPLLDTITRCTDIRKFISVRNVTGGGSYIASPSNPYPQYLGKAVRWYYGKTPGSRIVNSKGHKVAGTDNCIPCMTLPDTFPADVDHEHYYCAAIKMLNNVGVK